MKKLEVPLVEKPADMIGKVDGMLIEAVDGSVHYERARPFLEAGIPCFVDKPFTCSRRRREEDHRPGREEEAAALLVVVAAVRPELVDYCRRQAREVLGASSYGPASLHERNPGLFHYGIHAVEMLYTLMGPGCESVTCTSDKDVDVVTGHWKDGRWRRFAARGLGAGGVRGAWSFAEKATSPLTLGTKYIYRELLKKIVETFATGKPPIDIAVTVEIVGFIEAAFKSANNHGMVQKVEI